MAALSAGSVAPEVPGVSFGPGGTAVFFYKVTCPVCQMAAPVVQTFDQAYPGRITGVGQDPPEALHGFARRFGMTFSSTQDPPPYLLSDAYGIQVVPTTFLIDGTGTIVQTVESWDRDGLNELSRGLAELAGSAYAPISAPGDGLPPFRPG